MKKNLKKEIVDVLIGVLLISMAACTPNLDGIGKEDEKAPESVETAVILEKEEEVKPITDEEEKPLTEEIETSTEEFEEIEQTEENSSEEPILETEPEDEPIIEEISEFTYEEEPIEEVEEAPETVTIETEDYTMGLIAEELSEDADEDHYENMAAALAGEVASFEEAPEVEECQDEPEESSYNGMIYLGTWEVTAYEWTGYPCANGNYPEEYYTIACNSLPFGTRVYIEGIGERVVEDRGADWHSSTWIDLYLGDVDACYQFGRQYLDVYIIE